MRAVSARALVSTAQSMRGQKSLPRWIRSRSGVHIRSPDIPITSEI